MPRSRGSNCLNEALDPLFAEIPAEVDLFDRGISRGETPRLWIDAIAHIDMGRDKRMYRFLQDTRYGRKVLAEFGEHPRDGRGGDQISGAAADRARARARRQRDAAHRATCGAKRRLERKRRRRRALRAFLFGLLVGLAALVTAALLTGAASLSRPPAVSARSRSTTRSPSRCERRATISSQRQRAAVAVDAVEVVAGGDRARRAALPTPTARRPPESGRARRRARPANARGHGREDELGAMPRQHVAESRRRR